jgi:hypothetical protein
MQKTDGRKLDHQTSEKLRIMNVFIFMIKYYITLKCYSYEKLACENGMPTVCFTPYV